MAQSIRQFSTTAAHFVQAAFTLGKRKIIWQDKAQRKIPAEQVIAQAIEAHETMLAKKGVNGFAFRGPERPGDKPERADYGVWHWTLYVLVKGQVKEAVHMYPNSTFSKFWTTDPTQVDPSKFESHFTAEGEVAAVETAESSKNQGGGAEAKKPDA